MASSSGSAYDDRKTKLLMELECSPIKMDLESRPRTNNTKFEVSVGGLYLRDKATKDSIIPLLISPQLKVFRPYNLPQFTFCFSRNGPYCGAHRNILLFFMYHMLGQDTVSAAASRTVRSARQPLDELISGAVRIKGHRQ